MTLEEKIGQLNMPCVYVNALGRDIPAKMAACRKFAEGTLENAGSRAGDEMAHLCMRDVLASVTTPVRQLRGFQRLNLAPGESRTVRFELGPDDLSILDRGMKRVVEPGDFEVMVGCSAMDIRLRGRFTIHPAPPRTHQ